MPKIVVVLLSILVLVLAACAPQQQAGPATAPERGPQGSAVKTAWEQEWDSTLAAAKKEGKVVVYTGYGAEWREALSEPMARKYGISVDALTARSAEIAERVMREQKNRVFQADIVVVGSSQFLLTFQPEGALQSIEKSLILPEVTDSKVWWRGEIPWLDKDTKSYLQFYEYVTPPIVINTDMVKPGEVKAWKDLLNPKWKGQIVINDPTISGSGQKTMTMLAYSIMDWDYINQFAKQEPVIQRDPRLLVEWVARGKYPIVIAPEKAVVFEFAKLGAPITQMVPTEGAYLEASYGFVSQPKGSPHPSAAKVFINFLMSREGQTLSSRATGHQSTRVDVPTDHLESIVVRQPGIKYISTNDKDFMDKEVDLKKRVIEIFAPLKK
ncbi:MAG: extracellular solute-binding protein [Chloroflexi bacterium]|nr:extracellular solute-binding protein [Chloroflexota bacterium]